MDTHRQRNAGRGYGDSNEQSFRCLHCGMEVPCDSLVAGVQNRNHCPYCLWSRHLDGRVAGDRRSACRAAMQPVGLTVKRSRNKYGSERDGELMIIHQCSVCAKLSINRIAADDDDTKLLELIKQTSSADSELQARLMADGITALTAGDRELVRRRLYGTK